MVQAGLSIRSDLLLEPASTRTIKFNGKRPPFGGRLKDASEEADEPATLQYWTEREECCAVCLTRAESFLYPRTMGRRFRSRAAPTTSTSFVPDIMLIIPKKWIVLLCMRSMRWFRSHTKGCCPKASKSLVFVADIFMSEVCSLLSTWAPHLR